MFFEVRASSSSLYAVFQCRFLMALYGSRQTGVCARFHETMYTIATQNLPEETRFIVPARTYTFIFKREDETLLTTWPTRLWAFLLATPHYSLPLSLELSCSLSLRFSFRCLSREDSLYSILTVPTRARTAHLQLVLREVIFAKEKKRDRYRDSYTTVASRDAFVDAQCVRNKCDCVCSKSRRS